MEKETRSSYVCTSPVLISTSQNSIVGATAVHRHTNADKRSLGMACASTEVSNIPDHHTQKAILEQSLDRRPVEGDFWYVVVAEWLETLKRFLGISSTRKFYHQRTHPGPVVTRRDYAHTVDVVHEEAWKMFVQWYGLTDGHKPIKLVVYGYSRASDIEHNLNSFKVMMCNAPIEEFQNVRFSKMERVGHVEWKVREVFRISKNQATRLWAKPDADGEWRTVFSRDKAIGKVLELDSDFTRPIVAMELCDADGIWSNSPETTNTCQECPTGQLYEQSIFENVTSTWEIDIHEQIDNIGQTILEKLHTQFNGFVLRAKEFVDDRETHIREKERDLWQKESVVDSLREKTEEKEQRLEAEILACENRIKEYECRKLELEREYAKKKEDVEKYFREGKVELDSDRQMIEKEKDKFEEELKRMSEMYKIQDGRIKLDIGGHQFTTSLLTLTKDPNSMLSAMFSGRHELKTEADGSYFIDRDGTHFRYILNYLRDGGMKEGTLPLNENLWRELLTEAEYYQIYDLVEYLTCLLYRKNLENHNCDDQTEHEDQDGTDTFV